jgi:seryl-tRNA synthetase
VIDLRLLRDDPDAVRASQTVRGESSGAVDELLRADAARREAVQAFEALRAEQKQLSKRLPKATGEEKAALVARTKELSAQVKSAEAVAGEADRVLRAAHLAVPNVVAEGVPPGGEDDFRVLREVGLVDVRDEGRQRIYRLNGHQLKPIHDWVTNYERMWSERFDALDEVLEELKEGGADEH